MTSTKFKNDNSFNKYKNWEHIYCKHCGKSCYFKSNHQAICNVCGHIIYPSKRCEFKDMVNKEMKKQ